MNVAGTRRLFALLLIVLALPAAHAEAAKGRTEKRALVSGGKKRIYRYVPSGISAKWPAPLFVTLHASGGNGWSLVYK